MGATPVNTNKTYYNISGYNFTTRVDQTTKGAKKRTTKTGNDVYELWYSRLSGFIRSVREVPDEQYGDKYNIELVDNDEIMVLQIWKESDYADTFMSKIPNLDINKPVQLTAYSFQNENEGKIRMTNGINIEQDGVKLKSAFSKGMDNGQPTIEKLQDEGLISDPPHTEDWKLYFLKLRTFYSQVAFDLNQRLNPTVPPAPVAPAPSVQPKTPPPTNQQNVITSHGDDDLLF